MALGGMGSLTLMLRANTATFASDLGKAVTMANASMNQIARTVGKATDAFKMLAGGFGIYQVASFGLEVLKTTANLQSLSMMTGLSVGALSAISVEAQRAGTTVGDAASAFDRLQRSAGASLTGNRQLEATFRSIGISGEQLAEGLKHPEQMYLTVARALEKFADDGHKTVTMMALFGRAGADQIELLHNLALAGYSSANVTAEQAAKAKDFEIALANLSIRIKSFTLDLMMDFSASMTAAATKIQMAFENMWIRLVAGSRINVLTLKADLASLDDWIYTSGNAVRQFFNLKPKETPLNHYALDAQFIRDNAKTQIEANDAVAASAQKAYDERHALDEVYARGHYMAEKGTKPSIPVPLVPVPEKNLKLVDDLKKQMDAGLKILNDQIKLEDAANKTLNKQLDLDYDHGMLSLADYSVQKNKALEDSFVKTQAIRDLEIANARAYATAESEIYLRANAKANFQESVAAKITDPALANQAAAAKALAAQTRAKANAALSNSITALATAQEQADQKGLAIEKHEQDRLALSERLAAAGMTYKGILSDLDIAYATLNGNTALANELQMEAADALRKEALNANLNAEALLKLAAIQADQRLRSSQEGFAGMQRAVIDYAKGLADVAKATEAMTTRMLTGMEDALVSFVQTGKLNWRSLIDSMIADLIRMQIRASIMPAISGWLKLGMAALSAYAGGGAAVDTNAEGTAGFVGPPQGKAVGGPVSRGVAYQVGERGAERFVPSVAGTIVPNGASGGMALTYAPVIQIDARSDRAQVQQDTANIIRQGNRELITMLQRYNPGLKV